MVQGMADNPIVFALANPDPEIGYEEAMASREDVIMATGRSDHPNQVNNVLGFPYIFRGARGSSASHGLARAVEYGTALATKDAASGAKAREMACGRTVLSVAFSPDGAHLLTVGSDDKHTVFLWDWKRHTRGDTPPPLMSMPGMQAAVPAVWGAASRARARAARRPCRPRRPATGRWPRR